MFQIICVTCPTCHRNFRSSQWVFLGLFISVRIRWKIVSGWLAFRRTLCLWDRHRAPAMTRDSVCFGVYVDGVCAVRCIGAVQATLQAAGLQCAEVEADTSKQVHRSSVGITRPGYCCWKLLVFAGVCCAPKTSYWIPSGQINWTYHLELPAASFLLCLSSMPGIVSHVPSDLEADGYCLRSSREFRWIASLLPLLTCNLASPWSPWVYAADASGGARGGLCSYASLV